MYVAWFLRWVAPYLITLLPLNVLVQITVVLLRSLAKKTTNTVDDEVVRVLERYFNVPPEEVKENANDVSSNK